MGTYNILIKDLYKIKGNWREYDETFRRSKASLNRSWNDSYMAEWGSAAIPNRNVPETR